jgi:dipeptidyl aminopeptidase/acylaminoacyl peptidase
MKRSRFALLMAGVMLGLLGVAPGKATGAVSTGRAEQGWSVVSQHVDTSVGDVTGLDVLRAGDLRPRALVRRPVGSRDWDNQPTWSPDGRRVAYATSYSHWGLYVLDAARGKPRQLATGSVSAIAWSPDGAYIAFGHTCASASTGCVPGVFVVGTRRGARVRRVFPADGSPEWSPDGRQLVCLCGKAIWAFDADGSHRQRLSDAADGRVGQASWSPGGHMIAFGRRCNEGWNGPGGHDVYCDVAVMNEDGSGKRTVLSHGDARGPSNSPPVWASEKGLLIPLWGFARGIVSVDWRTRKRRLFYKQAGWIFTSPSRAIFAVLDSDGVTFLEPSSRVIGRRALELTGADFDIHLG